MKRERDEDETAEPPAAEPVDAPSIAAAERPWSPPNAELATRSAALASQSTSQQHVIDELESMRPDLMLQQCETAGNVAAELDARVHPQQVSASAVRCAWLRGRNQQPPYGGWAAQALAPLETASRGPVGASLVSLSLWSLPLTGNHALAHLAGLAALRALRIEDCAALPTEALRALQPLTELQLVSFRGCSALTDQAVGFLLPMTKLVSLQARAAPPARCPRLRWAARRGAPLLCAPHAPLLRHAAR